MKRALILIPAALLTAVAGAFIAGSPLLLRRRRDGAAALCLVGSIGYFIFGGLQSLGDVIWDSEVRTLDGCIYVHWSLCTLENWAALATLCFPIGFVWSALLPRDAPNQAMERTADRGSLDS
jgi:hypothetical protein